MEIRLCTEADIVSVGAFYDEVVKYLCENVNYPKWTYKEYPSEGSVRKMTEACCQFVCMDGEQVVGAFVFNEDPQGQYENAAWSKGLSEGEYMVCHTLATAPQVYGKGIGRQMIEYCIAYAKERGFRAIRLDVVPDNVPAKRLYEKCGFVYVGDVDLERGIEAIPEFSMYEYWIGV
ncbi:MAG: GNAT family N-acetyltransferase [Lachnospiraceae bacterium]|nr:GNAT family N-acetyltransferase [Lachnospiraceae bacterium]